jgi:UDP-N-acetylglucosamine 3-dehydrogenase
MIGAAIVGAGFIGQIHSSCIEAIEGAKIRWVLDIDENSGMRLAEKTGAEYTRELSPILADRETHVVIHGLPTIYRLGYLQEYVKAGKHIFCEKPLARTLDEAKKVVRLVRAYRRIFYVGHVVRFFFEYEQAHRLVKEKAIGTPGIVRVSRCSGFPNFGSGDWYNDFEKSGGVALDLAIHDFDFLLWTFGPVRRIFASGLLPRTIHHTDYLLAIMNFQNGMLAHAEASWCESRGSFWTSFEIAGSEGLIEFDSRTAMPLVLMKKHKEEKESAGTATIKEKPLTENPYLRQMRHFLSCVETAEKPRVTVADAYRALQLSLSALDSVRSGKPVTIKSA